MVLILRTFFYTTEGGRKQRGRGSGEGADADGDGDGDSYASEGDNSADDDRPRKRGRPPASHREKIKGFTDAEVSIDLST